MKTQMNYQKRICILVAVIAVSIFMFASCGTTSTATAPAEQPPEIKNVSFEKTMSMETGRLWTFLPEGGNPLFIGYSTNLYDDEEEEYKALVMAAQYASAYQWLDGETGFLDSRKGQSSYTEIRVSMETAVSLFEDLEVVDIHQDGKGTVLVAKLKGASGPKVGFDPIPKRYPKGDPPSWLEIPPEIPGYYVALGIDEKKFDLPASFLASDKMALAELLRQVNLKVKAGESEQTNETVGQINLTVSSQRSAAELKGVYVLARYQSRDGKLFYTLAICPKNQ